MTASPLCPLGAYIGSAHFHLLLYEQDKKQIHGGLVGSCGCWLDPCALREWYCACVVYSLGEGGLTFKYAVIHTQMRFLREESGAFFH